MLSSRLSTLLELLEVCLEELEPFSRLSWTRRFSAFSVRGVMEDEKTAELSMCKRERNEEEASYSRSKR